MDRTSVAPLCGREARLRQLEHEIPECLSVTDNFKPHVLCY